MELSVLVCTRDRAASLKRLLESLALCEAPPGFNWEIVVVDNGSRDNTRAVVESIAPTISVGVRLLDEPRAGRSYAFNLGIDAVCGRLVALTDDDIVVTPDWIVSIARHAKHEPARVCWGGMVKLFDVADVPVTIRTSEHARLFDRTDFSPSNIPVLGCNLVMRTDVLRQIGRMDALFGPGSNVGSGDDLELLYRFLRRGHLVAYDPSIVVLHAHGRRDSNTVAKLNEQYLMGRGAFYCKYLLCGDLTMVKWMYWELIRTLREYRQAGFISRQARAALRPCTAMLRGALRYLGARVLGFQ
ncbi:MAG TPA: glycosyltransferase family A protein [Burkholderiaceae bacterium]|nr:glycosyltransferase family A protein [Burkholderiaceae bacterium]